MKSKTFLFAFFALAVAGALSAATSSSSRVEVTFVQPEKFADVKNEAYGSDRGREEILASLKAHVEHLARFYVSEGQHLTVRFTDIDLAGDFEPWLGPRFDEIRILKDIYPPRMTVEFTLTGADGKVISEGKRELQDLGYLMHSVLPTNDNLRFDKELLSVWMRQEFRRSS